jgi:predicted DsbA family dithiol-disulfide isomerase
MSHLTIDVVSDVICPWCYIGTRRLEQALEPLRDLEAEVTYRPFLLDPTTPPEGADLRERLRAKYGADPESMFARVEAEARSSGIALDFSKVHRTPNTIAAHTLLRHAIAKGSQRALATALFEAYFLEGLDVGKTDVLAAIGSRHGFGVDEATRIARDDAELWLTRTEAKGAAASGIRGVPFYIFGGRSAVSGAQPREVLRAAIERAAAENVRTPDETSD